MTENGPDPAKPDAAPIDEDEPIDIAGDVAHPARVYDYVLGGQDNFAADRAVVDHAVGASPGGIDHARFAVHANQEFLRRSVRYLAADGGIRQFIDIGTGIPSPDCTHQVAQRIAPESRVVYVDDDAVVLANAHTLRKTTPEGATAYIDGDPRDVERILKQVPATLDLGQPVAVILIGILYHISDDDDPHALVGRLMEGVPAGSYLVISHLLRDVLTEDITEAARRINEDTGFTLNLSSRGAFTRFFDGLEMVEPGVVPVDEWRPDDPAAVAPEKWPNPFWGAVARKP